MGGCEDGHIRCDHGAIADVDVRVVDQCGVVVDVDVFAEMDMPAALHGMIERLDAGVFARFREELVQEALLFRQPSGVYPAALYSSIIWRYSKECPCASVSSPTL